MSLLFFELETFFFFLFRDVVTGPFAGFQNHKSAHGLIRLCLFHKSRNKMSRFFHSPDVRLIMLRGKHTRKVSPGMLKTKSKLKTMKSLSKCGQER